MAQLNELTQVSADTIRTASDHGASTFVLIVMMILLAGFAGLWVWKVVIPDREVKRACEAKLTETISRSSMTLDSCQQLTTQINGTSLSTDKRVRQLLAVAHSATNAMEKLAHHAQVDLDSELGQMRGILQQD